MSTKKDILSILESDRSSYVSGNQLSEELGVSRTAVWKAVNSLRQEGHRIHSVPNKGYMLDQQSNLITEEGIRLSLSPEHEYIPIVVLKTVDSTNTYAKKLALEGATHGTLVLSEEQTEGRGRRGKNFFSPNGTGVYMSLILRPSKNVSHPQLITVAAAISVCRAMETVCGVSPGIKWVNDIYIDERKVCGILTEAVVDFESGGVESIVLGIGINCFQPEGGFPDELSQIACALEGGFQRNKLAGEITEEVLSLFGELESPSILEEYGKRLIVSGRIVDFLWNGEPTSGLVKGINNQGNLLVETLDGEILTLQGGEISVRSKKDQK